MDSALSPIAAYSSPCAEFSLAENCINKTVKKSLKAMISGEKTLSELCCKSSKPGLSKAV